MLHRVTRLHVAAAEEEEAASDPNDSFIVLNAMGYTILAGNWQTSKNNSTWNNGFVAVNGTHADGDKIRYARYMEAGTWRMNVIAFRSGTRGILKVDVDGTNVGSKDLYKASAEYNTLWEVTGITVATSGLINIDVYVDGKHASATNHYINWAQMIFRRTSA